MLRNTNLCAVLSFSFSPTYSMSEVRQGKARQGSVVCSVQVRVHKSGGGSFSA